MNMEMQQMLAHLLAEMRSSQEEMREEIKSGQAIAEASHVSLEVNLREEIKSAFGDKMGALVAGMKDGQKETMACQETTKAHLVCKEPSPKKMEPEVERQEVPTDEAAAKSARITIMQHKGRHLAAGRRVKLKKLTQGDCGSWGKLAATCREVSRRAAVA
jgi:hypothetical protein